MDSLVFSESISTDLSDSDFTKKKWVYATDSNGSSYQSQVVIDSTSISNSGAYVNWSEGFIIMPLVVSLTSAVAANLPIGTTTADMSWGFKAGFWHMINSMSVKYNNGDLVQETPFLNAFASFRAMTEWGMVDIINDGASCGFYPDNGSSWSYCSVDSTANNLQGNGQGLCNNRNDPSLVAYSPLAGAGIVANLTTASPFLLTSAVVGIPNAGVYGGVCAQNNVLQNEAAYNDGFLKRQFYTSFDPYSTNVLYDPLNQTAINSAASLAAVSRNYKQRNDTVAGVINWNVVAKLRLKDLADVFGKFALSKGGTFRFLINTNQTIISFTTTAAVFAASGAIAANGYPTIELTSVSVNGGLTCPLMLASANLGQGLCALPEGDYQLSVSIYKNNFNQGLANGARTSNITACRLYVPLYHFSPGAEQQYLSVLDNKKKIIYTDIFQYTQSSITTNSPFNFLVSNGLPNIQSVIVIPLINSSSNGTAGVSTLLSPFSTTGGTPDPITLTNFNVAIANQNLFEENILYDYELFKEQLRTSYQLNGDCITGMSSGLISEMSFSRGMRYYYADASRQLPSDDGVSKSVQVKGTNASSVTIDILVFITFRKFIEIDVSNGAVLSRSS
jgi:hypothetical protein